MKIGQSLFGETHESSGSDFWPYGIESNRKAFETFIRYCCEQGIINRPMAVEELFVKETLDTFRV